MVYLKKIEEKPDYSEIIDLIKAEWPIEFGDKSDEEKIDEMNKSHDITTDTVKYLYEDDTIIGFYRYSLWPRDDNETKQVHTYDVAILPEYQRQGYGIILMEDMKEECKKNGIESILSRSFKNNEGSIKLHKKMKFHLFLETEDSYVWELSLLND